MRGQRIKFVVAIAVIVGAVALLMAGKLKDAFRYSESVEAVSSSGEALLGQAVRIQGKLVDDSLVKKRENGRPYYELQVQEGSSRLTVRYDDSLPDTLVNGADVTAEGSLARPGYFHATKLFAKCPSKYESAKVPPGYRPKDPYSTAGRTVPEQAVLTRPASPSSPK
jgi:cytochrome c-type biogenesis protein CcmE